MANFVEAERFGPGRKVLFRLHFTTDTPMNEIIQTHHFQQLTKTQNLKMTISELPTPTPRFVGFFDEPLPTDDRISLINARIEKAYKNKILFKYQTQVYHLRVDDPIQVSAPFYLILADKDDLNRIRETFEDSAKKIGTAFLPWN